jgi:hypothetical protein
MNLWEVCDNYGRLRLRIGEFLQVSLVDCQRCGSGRVALVTGAMPAAVAGGVGDPEFFLLEVSILVMLKFLVVVG